MKKTVSLLALVLITTLLFSACNKVKDETPGNEEIDSATLVYSYTPEIELDTDAGEYITLVAVYGEAVPEVDQDRISPEISAGDDGVGYVIFGVGSPKTQDGFDRYCTYRITSSGGYIVSAEETETFTREKILEYGVPYVGELNGVHTCKLYGKIYNLTVEEKNLTIATSYNGINEGTTYDGSLRYNPIMGYITAFLEYTYRDKSGITYKTSGTISGKLYEYGGFVHFLCEESGVNNITPNKPIPLTFVPQYGTARSISISDWAEMIQDDNRLISEHCFYTIRAFLEGDVDAFARRCSVSADVYAHMRGMKIGSYRLYKEEIAAYDDPTETRTYPVLEFEVTESNSSVFPVGTHRLVWDEGLAVIFTPREQFRFYSQAYYGSIPNDDALSASRYISALFTEDFSWATDEYHRYRFIVSRLNTIAGDYEPRTEDEIRAYAEKYLGLTVNPEYYSRVLMAVEGGYQLIGRGGGPYLRTDLSEEVRDGITVVTSVFWADYSMTVPSRKVEFHLELLDGEYKPIKTVVLEDYGFRTVYYST